MGTAIVGLVLVALVAAIITSLVKSKKNGKSSCGGSCAHCAMGGKCHKEGEVSPSLQPSSMSFATPSAGTPRNAPYATILEIDGMMCPMCESHINDAIRNKFKVKSVKSDYKTGICQIISEEDLDKEKLRTIIKATGYKVK